MCSICTTTDCSWSCENTVRQTDVSCWFCRLVTVGLIFNLMLEVIFYAVTRIQDNQRNLFDMETVQALPDERELPARTATDSTSPL